MKYTTRASFLKSLKNGAPSRFYAIAIADEYERAQMVNAVLQSWGAEGCLVERFQGSELRPAALLDALQTQSLLGGDPIVVLEEADKIPKAQLAILQPRLSSPMSYGRLIVAAKAKTPLLALGDVVFDLLDEKPWEKDKRLQELIEERIRSAGASIASDALVAFLERLEKDSAMLESEVDKLLCYTAKGARIEVADVIAITASSRTWTVWQMAEELIWEGRTLQPLDASNVHAILSLLRTQLQMGMKISELLHNRATREEWSAALPKVFAKTLEKRTSMAARLGRTYFAKGLEALFELELASRSSSADPVALLDRFRAKLALHVAR